MLLVGVWYLVRRFLLGWGLAGDRIRTSLGVLIYVTDPGVPKKIGLKIYYAYFFEISACKKKKNIFRIIVRI